MTPTNHRRAYIIAGAIGVALIILGFAWKAKADPPATGTIIQAGTQGIVCLKDVAADTYKDVTKASEVKPRLDALFAAKTCAIIVIPIDLTVTAVAEVGSIETDLSASKEKDDVYSLTAAPPDKSGAVYVLWAETAPPSV